MPGTLLDMKTPRFSQWVPVFVALLIGFATSAVASPADTPLPESVEDCLLCHDDDASRAILAGPHAVMVD